MSKKSSIETTQPVNFLNQQGVVEDDAEIVEILANKDQNQRKIISSARIIEEEEIIHYYRNHSPEKTETSNKPYRKIRPDTPATATYPSPDKNRFSATPLNAESHKKDKDYCKIF